MSKTPSILALAASMAALGGLPSIATVLPPRRSPRLHGKHRADPEKKAARKRAKEARRRNRR